MEYLSSLTQTGSTNPKQGNISCRVTVHQNNTLNFNTNLEVCTSYKFKSFFKVKNPPK